MDAIARYNIERWKALVSANAAFTCPVLNIDPDAAQQELDPEKRYGTLAGKDVLCLAGGGGQQSVAFAVLGANVTVFDLSEEQLQQDRVAATHLGMTITTVQGDMRDLSNLDADAFDIVNHAYSLGFVPNAYAVFEQVARVIRPGGIYSFHCANPFVMGTTEKDWNGIGYTLKHTYLEGDQIQYDDQAWVYDRSKTSSPIQGPREFRHTLSSLISGLVHCGFMILHVSDYSDFTPNPNAQPGTWSHFTSVAPPWLSFWASYRPDVLLQKGIS